jgi:hypothetical protein
MDQAVRHAITAVGLPVADGAAAASTTPARLLGMAAENRFPPPRRGRRPRSARRVLRLTTVIAAGTVDSAGLLGKGEVRNAGTERSHLPRVGQRGVRAVLGHTAPRQRGRQVCCWCPANVRLGCARSRPNGPVCMPESSDTRRSRFHRVREKRVLVHRANLGQAGRYYLRPACALGDGIVIVLVYV